MRNNLFNKKFKFFADITESLKPEIEYKIKKIISCNVDNSEKK